VRLVGASYRRIDVKAGGAVLVTAYVTAPQAAAKVLLRPQLIGVCRSDLREIQGARYRRRDFGHEIYGQIVSSYPEEDFPVGARVIFDPHHRVRRTSGFAELVEMEGTRRAVAGSVVFVPAGVPPEAAVFAEPLACAVHCVSRLARITEQLGLDDGPVAIVGAGMAGTLMALQLERLGVPVSMVNRTRDRSAFLAERSVVRSPAAGGIIAEHSFQRVIVATANVEGWAFKRAVSLVSADSGVVLIFGGTRPGISFRGIDLDAVRRGERLAWVGTQGGKYYLGGTYGANASDFTEALRLLEDGSRDSLAAPVARLIARRIPLPEAAPFLSQEAQAGSLIGKAVVEVGPASSGT
jgi:threonine dehydrogenase-like Zn-dependent dehydrogenase